MRPLPPNQPTSFYATSNAEYYRWLMDQLTAPLGLQTFSVKQLREMIEDRSLIGRHGLNHSEVIARGGATCQYEALMESTQFIYVVVGSEEANNAKFRLEVFNDKVNLDYTGQCAGATQRGHFGNVFTTVVARFGNVCETRYGLSRRRCVEKSGQFRNDGAPLDMKECTEWVREKYGAHCKCMITLRAAVMSLDQALRLPRDIQVIKSILQLAESDGNRPFSRSTATSFELLGTSRPESVASNITLSGTEYSDDTGSSTSFERLSMQQ